MGPSSSGQRAYGPGGQAHAESVLFVFCRSAGPDGCG